MNLLKLGTGNQARNRQIAVKYIVEHLIEAESYDLDSGTIVAKDGRKYHVSAYAETSAAFVSTPGLVKTKNSIYASGLLSLMYYQVKDDSARAFVYEVDPQDIYVKPNSNSAEWREVDKAATRIWVCTKNKVTLYEKKKEVN